MEKKNSRLRELDFLRGIAIILVLFRHHLHNGLTDSNGFILFIERMGWIGVDLFFVLSGFLVSGLLFKEYLKYGNIKPSIFLIRRGFKIYPIYYLTYILYLIPILMKSEFNMSFFLADIFFIQNYFLGAGWAYPASWSLAVEEHFYFAMALISGIAVKRNFVKLKIDETKTGIGNFEWIILTIMFITLLCRIASNVLFPAEVSRNTSMTHLRIDSLLAGVLISYLFYFRFSFMKLIFKKYRLVFLILAVLGLSWTPFYEPVHSFFVKTLGYSLLLMSFGLILVYFLLTDKINHQLNYLFSEQITSAISKIGFCSYSIYIIHPFVNSVFAKVQIHNQTFLNHYLNLVLSSVAAIAFGMFLTYFIEKYFLKIRDKYFPNRAYDDQKANSVTL